MRFKLFTFSAVFMCSFSFASNFYWMCGPDEDGCNESVYSYCSCTPQNEKQGHEPYCLDLTRLVCIPLSQAPKCSQLFILSNQGECLATLFQSMPTPSCKLVTRQFCIAHQSPICNADGYIKSCKTQSQ